MGRVGKTKSFTTALHPGPLLSRRDLMALGAGAGLATLLPTGTRAQPVNDRIEAMLLAMAEGQGFDLPVRRSNGGMLDTRLDIGYATHSYPRRADGRPGRTIYTRSYEGQTTGPTLDINAGEWLRVTSTNSLPADRVFAGHNYPNRFNTYNLHTHGLHVSPTGNSDNVVDVEVAPGETFVNEIYVPVGHPPGLYWYHPHRHGATAIQVSSGLAGALVIRGATDALPAVAAARERIMVLQSIVTDESGRLEDFQLLFSADESVVTINGIQHPVITMRPGEVQNWRVVNACNYRVVPLYLEGHGLTQYDFDGNPLPAFRRTSGIKLAPGNRASFLVRAGTPGLYFLKAAATSGPGTTVAYGETTLAVVLVAGAPVSMELPAGALPLPASLAPIADGEITGRRSLVMNEYAGGYPDAYLGVGLMFDNRRFDADRIDHHVRLGAVEEWTVSVAPVSPGETTAHPFHIHTNPIYVTRVNGQPLATPYWCDTALVEGLGSITFRTRFTDFTGRMVLHCHILSHEDLGMMQLIEISA